MKDQSEPIHALCTPVSIHTLMNLKSCCAVALHFISESMPDTATREIKEVLDTIQDILTSIPEETDEL